MDFSQPKQDGVDQWGVLSGTYQEGAQNEEKQVYLRGIRQRRWGPTNLSTLQKWIVLKNLWNRKKQKFIRF